MGKFRKEGKKGQPAVNTAALPDIVFMLLFFFMVATRPKEKEPANVDIEIPGSSVSIELNKDDESDYIWAGFPMNGGEKALVEVFLDDQLAVNYPSQIRDWKKGNLPPEMEPWEVVTILKIDNDVDMKTVYNIKEALRANDVKAYKISYSTSDK